MQAQTEESKTQSAQAAATTEEEKKEEAEAAAKHQALANEASEAAELIENKHTKNLTGVFINQRKAWDDENDFQISPELIRGITEELGFIKPSNIQGVAIPMITDAVNGVHHDLIAQSKNGSGKTGAFAIGTTLRVDPAIMKP